MISDVILASFRLLSLRATYANNIFNNDIKLHFVIQRSFLQVLVVIYLTLVLHNSTAFRLKHKQNT